MQGKTAAFLLDKLNNQIKNDSLNPDYYHERAKFYYENDELNEAFKDITAALELDSTFSDYYITQSEIYLGMGKIIDPFFGFFLPITMFRIPLETGLG